jgi:hypothetical protein
MKPLVMVPAVFAAPVGLFIAPGGVDPLLGTVSIISITEGAGAAGVLNMWYDVDINTLMTRTARRPILTAKSRGPKRLDSDSPSRVAQSPFLAIFVYVAVYWRLPRRRVGAFDRSDQDVEGAAAKSRPSVA